MLSYDIESASAEEIERVMRRGETAFEESLDRARPIVDAIRRDGDSALIRFAEEYEGFKGRSISIPNSALKRAASRIPSALLSAFKQSQRRIESYHSRQMLRGFEYEDSCGTFGQRVIPLRRVGIYAPGGTASYASSVLMAVVPAREAGVKEIVLCTPSKEGEMNDAVLAAAYLAGVDEVYAVGGAHAIAAMAYGTETIRPVLKIVGPGGAIVTAAKQIVRKDCEIDFLAGPSEVLIIADGDAEPELIAKEMLAQLEHDPNAVAMMVSTSEGVLEQSKALLDEMSQHAERRDVVKASAEKGAVFLKVRSIQQAVQISNEYAPEHLLIDVKDPDELLDKVECAGSVFLGKWSSVAFGDYCAGTNHVLPTMGTARSQSALSVYDFIRILPYQKLTEKGAERLAPTAVEMARAEGLPGHASAAIARAGGDEL